MGQFLRTATKYIKSFPKYQKKKEFYYYYFSKKNYSQFFFVPYTTPSLSCCLYIYFFFFIILRNQRNKPLKENLKKIAFYSSMEKKVIIIHQKIVPSYCFRKINFYSFYITYLSSRFLST